MLKKLEITEIIILISMITSIISISLFSIGVFNHSNKLGVYAMVFAISLIVIIISIFIEVVKN